MSSLFKTYPYELEALEYDKKALEPYIDEETLNIHNGKHQQNYVNTLNKIIEENPIYMDWTLDDFFRKENQVYAEIRTGLMRNAGGIYNHEQYFAHMTPNGKEKPEGDLADAIDEYFGSFEGMKNDLMNAALSVFGSGYAYLVVTKQGWLQIITLQNQETPVAYDYTPIVIVDCWEHAYYLKYQNRRADYLENWWKCVNWEKAEEEFQEVYDKVKKFEFGF